MAGINAPPSSGASLLKALAVALMWRKCQRGSTLRVLFQRFRSRANRDPIYHAGSAGALPQTAN